MSGLEKTLAEALDWIITEPENQSAWTNAALVMKVYKQVLEYEEAVK